MDKQYTEILKNHINELVNLLKLTGTHSEVAATELNIIVKILEKYKELDSTKLPQTSISLAKCFDFYNLDLITNREQKDIFKLIRKIVILSSRLLRHIPNKNKQCGIHEDGACVIQPHSKKQSRAIKKPQSQLPISHAVNFCPTPKLTKFKKGTLLLRVIDPNNSPIGSYWFRRQLPQSKREWRKLLAVLKIWNLGSHYVELKLPSNIKAWEGDAASQQVPNEQCILQGGGKQIWIPPYSIKQLK